MLSDALSLNQIDIFEKSQQLDYDKQKNYKWLMHKKLSLNYNKMWYRFFHFHYAVTTWVTASQAYLKN